MTLETNIGIRPIVLGNFVMASIGNLQSAETSLTI